MTATKTSKQKKITGVVSALSASQVTVVPPKGKIWEITRTPTTKVTVISGKPLRVLRRVTVEFNPSDGKQIGRRFPGKRTETGTVIGLTASLIELDNTTPDSKTWSINRTASTVVLGGILALGSTVRVESAFADWDHLA